ncbi:helix-turn-helix domain-containing protein [Brevibacterium litoralis]|uniref:helix-turn-helix domain-containing protein n=1 Tax=Brevibacterium litoralis TaxID=3138935 RepID=UPI0032EFA877
MSNVPSLGALIRQQREVAALTMRQLATMSGISGPYLSQIENGLRRPSEQVLRNLATTLGLEPEDLLGRDTADIHAAAREATITAIRHDPNLSPAQQASLLEVYRAMAGESAAGESAAEAPSPADTTTGDTTSGGTDAEAPSPDDDGR